MRSLVLSLLLLLQLFSFSQTEQPDSTNWKPGIKIFCDFSAESLNGNYYNFDSRLRLSFITKSKRGSYFEFGIDKISFSKDQEPQTYLFNNTLSTITVEEREFNCDLRVDYNLLINPNNNKYRFYIGVGNFIRFNTSDKEGFDSYIFPANQQNLTLLTLLQTKIERQITSALLVDASLGFGLSKFGIHSRETLNPIIRVDSQRVTSFDFDFIPQNYTGRIGLTYMF